MHAGSYQDHPLDSFSLLGQKVEKYMSETKEPLPYFGYVHPNKIQIEIINSEGELQGVATQHESHILQSSDEEKRHIRLIKEKCFIVLITMLNRLLL